jgi:hypothetical protein
MLCAWSSPSTSSYSFHFALTGTTRQIGPTQPSKAIIPEKLRSIYAKVLAKAIDLQKRGKKHSEICKALNKLGYRTRTGKPWRHPQQIIKLLRSFGGES